MPLIIGTIRMSNHLGSFFLAFLILFVIISGEENTMEKIDLKEIEKVETKCIVKNLNWFYHGFDFGNITKIMRDGILAKKYLDFPTSDFGLNGKHYISISKDIINHPCSAFQSYKSTYPLVILDNVETIKCKNNPLYYHLRLTSLPFRYSDWVDEYHVYSKISPDKFIGIECMVYDWARDDGLFLLKRFRNMLEVMQSLDTKLPVYDFSRQKDGIVHEIDQEEFLSLTKCL